MTLALRSRACSQRPEGLRCSRPVALPLCPLSSLLSTWDTPVGHPEFRATPCTEASLPLALLGQRFLPTPCLKSQRPLTLRDQATVEAPSLQEPWCCSPPVGETPCWVVAWLTFPPPTPRLARAQLDADFGLSKEQLERLTERVVFYVTSGTKSLQRLFLVYDMVESIKVSAPRGAPRRPPGAGCVLHGCVAQGGLGETFRTAAAA